MSGQVDLQGAVGEVKVGVVALLLGDGGHLVDQLDAGHEALEAEGLGEVALSFYTCHLPTGDLTQQLLRASARQGRRIRSADLAVPLRKGCRHAADRTTGG